MRPVILRLATRAMGTRFELVLSGADEGRLRAVGEEALEEVAECHRRWSLFDASSLVARVNALAAERPVRVDPGTFALLELCREVHAHTRGAFDPTVAPLMRALGFHAADRQPAPAEALQRAAAAVGAQGLGLDPRGGTVTFERPGMAIDLGAIGKGAALDLAAEVLRENGVDCALLHGGTSTALALGAPPGEDGWRVAIGAEPDAPLALLRDAALSVSAPNGRMLTGRQGARGHVLDPRDDAAAPRADLAAVIAPRAALADAWSTALLVLGAHFEPPSAAEPLARLLALGPADDPRRWRVAGGGLPLSRFELVRPTATAAREDP